MKILNPTALSEAPSCVLLDLDNTLYEYDPAHAAGMDAVREYAEQQLRISSADFDDCFRAARAEIKQRLGPTGSSHHRLLYFQRTLEKAGLATQPMSALQMEQVYWSAFLSKAALFDDVLEFMDDLRIAGIPAIIVTDLTAQIQLRKLLYFNLHKYVDWMVTSEESGADKPAVGIFHLALAKIGGVEGTVWMIGDDPAKDIAGARDALGCTTFQKVLELDKYILQDSATPDAIFARFGDLREKLSDLI